jgi:hypothetical protein
VGLAQLVRFLVVELIYPGLNSRFDICVVFTTNYYFSGDDIPIDSEVVLMTDFVNFKIKPAQSFEGAHRDRMYVFIVISDRMYINI